MKTELPKKWYTIEELSERWGCRINEVEHLIDSGMLTAHKRYEFSHLNELDALKGKARRLKNFLGTAESVKVNIETDNSQDYLIVTPAEVDRFELEQGICWNADENESQKQFCERLKQNGLPDNKIAHELKKAFSSITFHRIGKLITEKPNITVTPDTYRKRGERFFEK